MTRTAFENKEDVADGLKFATYRNDLRKAIRDQIKRKTRQGVVYDAKEIFLLIHASEKN